MTDERRLFYEELERHDLIHVEYCTDEENEKFSSMPEDALQSNVEKAPGTKYYHRFVSGLTNEEMKLFLMAKRLSTLNIIKNCLITFVVLAVIGFVVGFILVKYWGF